jgi:hypothetical protein
LEIVPKFSISLSSIPAIPVLTPHLFTSTLDANDLSPQDCYGYISIDQTRHVLPTTVSDLKGFGFPLVGVWIYDDALDIQSMSVMSKIYGYLNGGRKRLEMWKEAVCLLMVVSRVTSTSSLRGGGKRKVRRGYDFYEVEWEQEQGFHYSKGESDGDLAIEVQVVDGLQDEEYCQVVYVSSITNYA